MILEKIKFTLLDGTTHHDKVEAENKKINLTDAEIPTRFLAEDANKIAKAHNALIDELVSKGLATQRIDGNYELIDLNYVKNVRPFGTAEAFLQNSKAGDWGVIPKDGHRVVVINYAGVANELWTIVAIEDKLYTQLQSNEELLDYPVGDTQQSDSGGFPK